MEIRFNATMFLINKTNINMTNIDIYMEPFEPEPDPGWNVTSWNLTWEPVEYNNSNSTNEGFLLI